MSIPVQPPKVKLVIGLIYSPHFRLGEIEKRLRKRFGEIETEGEQFEFKFTDYYSKEMGEGLWRKFLVFKSLQARDTLAQIKKETNRLENLFLNSSQGRLVNLDPGFLSLENFVLATGKGYTHRIYLRDGIWADLTLVFKKKSFGSLPWTYPDYQDPAVIEFFNKIRKKYLLDLKGLMR